VKSAETSIKLYDFSNFSVVFQFEDVNGVGHVEHGVGTPHGTVFLHIDVGPMRLKMPILPSRMFSNVCIPTGYTLTSSAIVLPV